MRYVTSSTQQTIKAAEYIRKYKPRSILLFGVISGSPLGSNLISSNKTTNKNNDRQGLTYAQAAQSDHRNNIKDYPIDNNNNNNGNSNLYQATTTERLEKMVLDLIIELRDLRKLIMRLLEDKMLSIKLIWKANRLTQHDTDL